MSATHIARGAAAATLLLIAIYVRRNKGRRSFNFDSPAVDRQGTHTVKHILSAKPEAGALQLWVADMELPICERIQAAIVKRAQHPTFGYTIQPTRIWEHAGAWLAQYQHWPHAPKPEAFVFSASVVSAFCNVLRALTSEGDGVVVMVPSYAPMQQVVQSCGRRLVLHAMRWAHHQRASREHSRYDHGYDMNLDVLAATLAATKPKVLLLLNPHNPSGRVWSRDELSALARLCASHGVITISDEIWGDWVLDSDAARFTPFAAVAGPAGCSCIVLNAPTKTFNLAGLHAAYAIIEDSELRSRYLAHVSPAWLHFGSTFATEAMLAAYQHGAEWLEAARAYVRANVEFLTAALADADVGVVAMPTPATYLVWLDCAALMSRASLRDKSALEQFMLDAGLVFSPGSEFDPTGASDHFMRLNAACPRSMLHDAVQRLRSAVASDALAYRSPSP